MQEREQKTKRQNRNWKKWRKFLKTSEVSGSVSKAFFLFFLSHFLWLLDEFDGCSREWFAMQAGSQNQFENNKTRFNWMFNQILPSIFTLWVEANRGRKVSSKRFIVLIFSLIHPFLPPILSHSNSHPPPPLENKEEKQLLKYKNFSFSSSPFSHFLISIFFWCFCSETLWLQYLFSTNHFFSFFFHFHSLWLCFIEKLLKIQKQYRFS